MKIFFSGKDGGLESNVTGYWLIESKSTFSIALLKFTHGTREVFHSHAFNCISWVLSGRLTEYLKDGLVKTYVASIFPISTKRKIIHKVFSWGTTWVFTIRGPWESEWNEYHKESRLLTTLVKGRKVIRKEIEK